MCINDQFRQKGKSEMSEGLDEGCKIPAYVCGRLMGVYENLQWTADDAEQKKRRSKTEDDGPKKEINLTITDRYFGLASTFPKVAFPRILDLSKAHRRKLKRDSAGASNRIEALIEHLFSYLGATEAGPFPAQLSLEGQGLFALGYYHQKAAFRSQIAAYALAKKAAANTDNESTNELGNESTDQEKN
jgi:CRISPR-associated protein Csd1